MLRKKCASLFIVIPSFIFQKRCDCNHSKNSPFDLAEFSVWLIFECFPRKTKSIPAGASSYTFTKERCFRQTKNTPEIGCAFNTILTLRSAYCRRYIWHPINISVHHNKRLLWLNLLFGYTNNIAYYLLIVNRALESFRQPLVYVICKNNFGN